MDQHKGLFQIILIEGLKILQSFLVIQNQLVLQHFGELVHYWSAIIK
jgi:hypothetical protein